MISRIAVPALNAAVVGFPTVITFKVGWILATILAENYRFDSPQQKQIKIMNIVRCYTI